MNINFVEFLQIILCTACLQLGMASITTIKHNLTNNEHQIQSSQLNKVHNDARTIIDRHRQPYFDLNDPTISTNITVMQGESAYMVCVVRNLGNNSISWIRHNDINLLSVGIFKYTQDPRYQIFHNSHNDTWTLKIRRVRKEDEGLFECQIGISTAQPVGRMIYLKVIDPQLSILEGNEMFTEVGSNLNLTCYIKQMLNGDDKRYSLRWSYNNQEINHHSPRGFFIITEHDDRASISHLMIKNVTTTDTGLYSCSTSIDIRASITLHVLHMDVKAMETIVLNSTTKLPSPKALTYSIIVTTMMTKLLLLNLLLD
ncbi:hypothetical protein ACKWTF_005810 [Chironomus riparius]